MLKDRFDRTINYLRISVTDRCNLRCGYCNPNGFACLPEDALLSNGEIARVCAQAARLGIDRLKITGGEPLLRKDLAALIAGLRGLDGVREITLTTNGVLLNDQLEDLIRAGIDAVNVSLDTLDRRQYGAITGVEALNAVLAGIHSAAGRLPVKVNCVVQRGVNEDAPLQLVELARDMPVDVRFIELMPIGAGKRMRAVPNASVFKELEARFGGAKPEAAPGGNGPAMYYHLNGFCGRIGFISPVHEGFCKTCNRLRLTSAGDLKPCLCYADAIPLRELLRGGAQDVDGEIRDRILEAVLRKPRAHCFERRDEITEGRRMAQIGG